jgi:hypothetical protein
MPQECQNLLRYSIVIVSRANSALADLPGSALGLKEKLSTQVLRIRELDISSIVLQACGFALEARAQS